MTTCIKCGDGSNPSTLCSKCTGEEVDKMSEKDQLAMAKVGLDALIDEATHYQEVRPSGDLAERHQKYKEDQDGK